MFILTFLSKIHPVCNNIANGIKTGSNSKMTAKHAIFIQVRAFEIPKPLVNWKSLNRSLANSVDPDDAACHQGLHCLLRQSLFSEIEKHYFLCSKLAKGSFGVTVTLTTSKSQF